MSSLLDFIYKGETNITKDHLQKFLHLAEELGVKGLNEEGRTENIPKQNFNADSGIVNIDSQLFKVKTENISKVNFNADCELVNIDSQMFDIIGENKIGSELVKPEITIGNTTENYPSNNIRIPIETKKFTCNIDQSYLDKQVLLMIIKQPWDDAIKGKNGKKKRTYKCNNCDLLSHSKVDCVNHVETHINGLRYTCTICEHVTKTSVTMKDHIKQHKQISQQIDKPNSSGLQYLEKDMSRNKLEIFNCNMDENEVNYKTLTMVEKQEEKGSHGSLYKCNVCNLVSRDKKDCLKHVERHIDGLSYSCLLCDYTGKTKAVIKVHSLRHEKISSDRIRNVRDFSSLASMDKYTLEEQVSLRIEKCVKHVNGNLQVKEWTCTVCGKVSLQKQTITAHVETHIEGLMYSCSHSDCSYSGKTRGAMGGHLSAAH